MDRIIVKRRDPETKYGRLHVVTNEKTDTGTVMAVGPGRIHPKTGYRMPVDVRVGEIVYFDKLAGQELEENGERYLVLTPDVIIGVAELETPAAAKFQAAIAALKWPEGTVERIADGDATPAERHAFVNREHLPYKGIEEPLKLQRYMAEMVAAAGQTVAA